MFQARQLFSRSSASAGASSPRTTSDAAKSSGDTEVANDRHPAMRGLDVSPVHGHHCICQRCDQLHDAA